jgi:hypothetical protein
MCRTDRVTQVLLALLVLGVWGHLLQSVVGSSHAGEQLKKESDQPPVLKARGLVIVDEEGRERIVMGAPVPDPKGVKRVDRAHGMIILDPQGRERFGLGLMDNGNMGMGFDAPPAPGTDKIGERVHIIADARGGATLRFTNRQTGVPGRLFLGDDDKLYLEFIDVQKDKNKVIRRRIGMDGEKTIEEPFK